MRKINIAIAGGPGIGKSTLAAMLFARVKVLGFDHDLISEEGRKLKQEMGEYRSPFERIYMWRQQEREELRSSAADGFITDAPLFYLYISGLLYVKEPRDLLAVRELLRMCLELKSADRYQIVVIPQNPHEVPYKIDQVRKSSESDARKKHDLTRSFVEHFWRNELLYVTGEVEERVEQVIKRMQELRASPGE